MKFKIVAGFNYLRIRLFEQYKFLNKIKYNDKKYNKGELNVAISTNSNFLCQTLVFVQSLENCGCIANLYILNINLSYDDIEKIKFISPKNVNVFEIKVGSKELKQLKISDKWPIEAWARVLIPLLIPKEYVIYIDVDCVVLGNLLDVLDQIDDKYILGVRSSYYYGKNYIRNGVNSGFLVFNNKKLNEFNFSKKVIQYGIEHKSDLIMPDQDSINMVCCNIMTNIPLKYNVMNFLFANTCKSISACINEKYYNDSLYKEAIFNPVVVHYNGGPFSRPWQNKRLKHPYYRIYQYYSNLVEKNAGKYYNEHKN